jgi:hypothetical protein
LALRQKARRECTEGRAFADAWYRIAGKQYDERSIAENGRLSNLSGSRKWRKNTVIASKKAYASTSYRFEQQKGRQLRDGLLMGRVGKGHQYLIGGDVSISRCQVERHHGANRYGNELQIFLFACVAMQAGSERRQGGFKPVCAAKSPSRCEGRDRGRLGNSLQSPSKRLRAILSFVLDEQGKPIGGDFLAGENGVLDGGVSTLDALQSSKEQFNPESLSMGTWEGHGIRADVLVSASNVVKKSGMTSHGLALMTWIGL